MNYKEFKGNLNPGIMKSLPICNAHTKFWLGSWPKQSYRQSPFMKRLK